MTRADNLAIVDNDPDDQAEEDAQAEQALIAAFANTSSREKREFAVVELPRYPNTPKRDSTGRLVRDGNGQIVLSNWELYFGRLSPETLTALRTDHTKPVARRERGRWIYDDKLDDEAYSFDVAWLSMLPWCRARYFEDQRLWRATDDVVGTAQEFMRVRLNPGELAACQDAVLAMMGLGQDQAAQLGKVSGQDGR